MKRKRTITPDEVKAERKPSQERIKELDCKGLCRVCGDRPQNPHLSPSVCRNCHKNAVPGGCHVNECLEDSAGTYQGVPLCEAHLADTVHKEYNRYLQLRSKLHQKERDLGFMIIKRDYPTEDQPEEIISADDPSEEINQIRAEIKQLRKDMRIVKSDIKYSMNSCDNLFPDNYEVFG